MSKTNPLDDVYTQVEYDIFLLGSSVKRLVEDYLTGKADQAFIDNRHSLTDSLLNLQALMETIKEFGNGQN